MARITVEDCIDKVLNRFELVILAAERGKDINSGIQITLDRDNDKDAVVSLREIASENIKIDVLRETLIKKMQTTNKIDQIDDETTDSAMLGDQDDDIDYTSEDSDFYADESDVTELDNEDDLEDFNPDS